MKVDVDITAELEDVIRARIAPAEIYGDYTRAFLWNLTAGTLTVQVKLANGVHGQKQVSFPEDVTEAHCLAARGRVYQSIWLAFELIEFIRKEGKRQVAPAPAEPMVQTTEECPWPNYGECVCEGSKHRAKG